MFIKRGPKKTRPAGRCHLQPPFYPEEKQVFASGLHTEDGYFKVKVRSTKTACLSGSFFRTLITAKITGV